MFLVINLPENMQITTNQANVTLGHATMYISNLQSFAFYVKTRALFFSGKMLLWSEAST